MSCTLCRLHKTCSSICIPGRGSENPKFLFVGQAPGEQEDLQNKVFIGPAGQLLLDSIKEYNLLPARLTNTVRCWPPNDREPKRDEVEACKSYLMKEIKEMKPEIIVAVGGTALKALTGKDKISTYAGRIAGTLGKTPIFALFHPAYILRSPSQLTRFNQQLQELVKIGQNGKGSKKDTAVLFERKNPYDLTRSLMNFEGITAFDFETTGKYKQFGGRIRAVAVAWENQVWGISAEDAPTDFDRMMRWFIGSERMPKSAHNSIFERRWCLDEWRQGPSELYYDTMLMHYLMDENSPHDLEYVAKETLGVSPWNVQPEMEEHGWTWETIPMDKLLPYCGKDAYYTLKIAEKQREWFKRAENKGLANVYQKILLPLSELCAKMEHRGMKLDTEWAAKVAKDYEREMGKNLVQMNEMPAVSKFLEQMMDLKAAKKKGLEHPRFNPGSSDQVRYIVYDILKLKPPFKTKTNGGKPTVKKEVIELLKGKHPFVDTYSEWKKLDSLMNNYLLKFPDFMDEKKLIHPNFNPGFQVTGRISVSNPPAGNMPRKAEVRGLIVSRFEGGKILARDYSQLEMRLLASEAGEEKMLAIFKQGEDVHDETAKQMFGKTFTPEQRAIAKNINFGTVYGISAYSLALKFNIQKKIAEEWIIRHQETYPGIYQWMKEQHKFIREHGYIDSRFGLRRRFPLAQTADDYELARMFRQAGNFPIQSLGAFIMNMSGVMIERRLQEKGLTSLYFHQIHDNCLVDMLPGEVKTVEKLTGQIMEKEIPSMCPWLRVKLPTDYKISYRWGGLA